jgi:hypothetical protein
LLGCGDDPTGSEPEIRREGELHFLRPRAGAPPLEADSVSFYAKVGQDREVRMRYTSSSGSGSGEFLRFRVRQNSLLRRPDGTPFAVGDSVRIDIVVVDHPRLIVDFRPAGLDFSPTAPAELRMEYGETDDDVDADGDVDARDEDLESTIGLWRQEAAGQPWARIGSIVVKDLERVEGTLIGFTRYALAY